MRQKSAIQKDSAERVVRDIRRKARRIHQGPRDCGARRTLRRCVAEKA